MTFLHTKNSETAVLTYFFN